MANDTKNALTDFDMCLALAQKAINSQMKAAWKAWIARSEFGKIPEMEDFALVDIFPLTRKGKRSKYGLSAEFAPLTVDLNVSNSKLGQVKVTLHLQSGTVSYFDEDEEERASQEIKNWSVSFLSDLDKEPCDLATLDIIDPDLSLPVRKAILESGLPDSVFSIEYLFMKFTQVDLLLSDNKDINIPSDVPAPARAKALTSINKMLQGETNGNFMMGAVVRRSKSKSSVPLPTFALTDFVFNVNANKSDPGASTLSYLGMFARQPLPTDIDNARLKLTDHWVQPEMLDGRGGLISGTMAISKERFLDQYLIKRVTAEVKISPQKSRTIVSYKRSFPPTPVYSSETELTWKFSDSSVSKRDSSDIINRKWNTGEAWEVSIDAVPGTNRLNISGRISSHAYMDGYTKGFNIGLGEWGNHHTEWIHTEGHQTFSSTLTLSGGTKEDGTDFDLEPTLSPIQFSEMHVDKDEVKGGAKALNFFEGTFTGGTTQERLKNQQAASVDKIRSSLQTALKEIVVDLSAHSFIPPGGGVFTFQRPRFSLAGDLLFDVIYKAP